MSQPEDPRERLQANLVGVVSTLVTGVWLAALLAGFEWWLPALIVGYVVVVPITAMLFGDEEEAEEWAGDGTTETSHTETGPERERGGETDADDALQTLRERYARGELTDEQFERKLDRLLSTETVEDAEDRARDQRGDERRREREHER